MDETTREKIFRMSADLVADTPVHFKRYLYPEVDWDSRLVCIKGARGVGKTTMLLQRIAEMPEPSRALYVSLDNVWMDARETYSLAEYHLSHGGTHFIMDEAHKRGMHAHTYAGDLVVSEYETEQLKTYCRLMQMDYVVVDDIRNYYGDKGPINVVVKPPIKVNVITPFEHSGLVDFRADMRTVTAGKLFDVFSKPEMLEFSHMLSNKGAAVRYMADFYHEPIENTVAVGDEENDCPMIEAAGVGVAMANASEAAKAVANYVTERDNNHSGIAEVIEKFIL